MDHLSSSNLIFICKVLQGYTPTVRCWLRALGLTHGLRYVLSAECMLC